MMLKRRYNKNSREESYRIQSVTLINPTKSASLFSRYIQKMSVLYSFHRNHLNFSLQKCWKISRVTSYLCTWIIFLE